MTDKLAGASKIISRLRLSEDAMTHTLFWTSLIIILTFLNINSGPFLHVFVLEFINVLFFAAIVYLNLVYIFPKYLEDKRMASHVLSLIVAAVIIMPIKTLMLYLVGNTPDYQQYFVENQGFIFLSTFFVGLASSVYFILNDWLVSQKIKQDLKNQTLQSELKFLKSQINPHFLFNTLNSLYALTLKKSDLAPEIVLKLSEMMRYMLYECNEKRVSLSKEVKYLQNYLELEKLRHGKKMDIDIQIDGEIADQQLAPLLFIPFVENCFKHGMNSQIKKGYVDINLDINETSMNISITNSKAPPMQGGRRARSGGIGLVNVKRRLDILYPDKYDLKIDDKEDEYTVHLQLQF